MFPDQCIAPGRHCGNTLLIQIAAQQLLTSQGRDMTIWDMRDPADAAIARWIANNAGGDPVQATALASWLERNPVARRDDEAGYVVIPYLGWRLAGTGKVDLLPDGSLPPLGTAGRDYPMPHLRAPAPLPHAVNAFSAESSCAPLHAEAWAAWRALVAKLYSGLGPSEFAAFLDRLRAAGCLPVQAPQQAMAFDAALSDEIQHPIRRLVTELMHTPRRRIKSGGAPGHRASSSSASRNIGYGARATARTARWNGHRTSTYPRGSRRRETADGRAARRRCLYLDGHSEAGTPKIISRSNRL